MKPSLIAIARFLALTSALATLSGCAVIKHKAVGMVASTLTSSGDVFSRETTLAGRPGDSVRPQALESLLDSAPKNKDLVATCSNFTGRRGLYRDRGVRARRGQSPRRGRASQRSGAEAVSPGARLLPARHGGAVPRESVRSCSRIRRPRSQKRKRRTCRCSTGRRRRGARQSAWRSTSRTSASTCRPCAPWPTGPSPWTNRGARGRCTRCSSRSTASRGPRRLDGTGARALQARGGASEGVVAGTLRRARARDRRAGAGSGRVRVAPETGARRRSGQNPSTRLVTLVQQRGARALLDQIDTRFAK